MPSKGTPHRGIRIDDALWREFQAATQQAGTNPSVVIRGLVREWTNKQKEAPATLQTSGGVTDLMRGRYDKCKATAGSTRGLP